MSDNGDAGGGGGGASFDHGDNGGNDRFDSSQSHHDTYHDNHHHYGNNHNYHYGEEVGNTNGPTNFPFCLQIIVLFVVLALGFGVGAPTFANSWNKNNSWSSVTGTIIARNSCGTSCSTNSNGHRSCSTTYAPVIEYVVNNTTYVITSDSCSNPGPTVGKDIKVLYDPSDPGRGQDGSFLNMWLLPTIFLTIGAIGCCCLSGITVRKLTSGAKPPMNNDFGAGGGMDHEPYKPQQMETSPAPFHANVVTTEPTPLPSAPVATDDVYTSSTSNYDSKPTSQTTGGATPSLFDQMNSKV